MGIKKERAYGVDLMEIAKQDAKKILARRERNRKARENLPYEWETHDTLCVLQTKLDDMPTYKWEVMTWPFGIEAPGAWIQASLADAARNKLSVQQMLEKRLRRLYRELLLEAKILPEKDALARVMRMQVTVVDKPMILLPGQF